MGAGRAVMTMRHLLGGIAAGNRAYNLATWADEGGSPQMKGPAFAHALKGNNQPKRFLTGYTADFNGKLPVVILDMQ